MNRIPLRRTAAAAIVGVAFACAGLAIALAVAPATPSSQTLSAGTAAHSVVATAATSSGCEPIVLDIAERGARSQPLDEIVVAAVMPTMGHVAGELIVAVPSGTTRIEGMCLAMAGPWELTVELRSATVHDTLVIPLHITG